MGEPSRPAAYKPVQLLDDADLADLRGIETTTHLVQRWVPKLHEVRMVVIGENITATAIQAGSPEGYVDFRSDYDTLSTNSSIRRPRSAPVSAGS